MSLRRTAALAVRFACYALAIALSIDAIAILIFGSIAVIEIRGALAYLMIYVMLGLSLCVVGWIIWVIRWAFDQSAQEG